MPGRSERCFAPSWTPTCTSALTSDLKARRDRSSRFLRHTAFELVLSAEIAAEILHALAYSKIRKAARSKAEPELWFEDILVLAERIPSEHQVVGISADVDDDKYVAAAIEGRAAFVVSGDPDLLEIKQHEGIRFVTPRTFLDLLGGA